MFRVKLARHEGGAGDRGANMDGVSAVFVKLACHCPVCAYHKKTPTPIESSRSRCGANGRFLPIYLVSLED